jgi:3-phenylpropionate/trans-cinnamate dioxygenase ferredoxin subunit
MDEAHPWRRVASLEDLMHQRRLVVEIDGLSILLLRLNTGVIAIHNRCTHLGEPLVGGRIIGGQIQCPFHGACFDLQTGNATTGPAVLPVRTFPARISDDDIAVHLA